MRARVLFVFTGLILVAFVSAFVVAGSAEDEIEEMTADFTKSVVAGDLSVVDRMFDPSPDNIYWDINEGPMVGMERLKRIWQAATRNSRLSGFEFGPDMKIFVEGDRALQTGTWKQVQSQEDGSSREIAGRATILWKKNDDGWRVYHYHGSITPARRSRR